MESIKNAASSASETVQGKSAEASKEGNKNVAQSDQQPLGTRAEAGKDAVKDKVSEQSHEAKS